MKLFLDDERNPIDVFWNGNIYNESDWYIVRNYEEFVHHITKNGLPSLISFDNDLAQVYEGIDCAKWLIDYCINNKLPICNYLVHSKNPVAKERISTLLEWTKKNYDNFF